MVNLYSRLISPKKNRFTVKTSFVATWLILLLMNFGCTQKSPDGVQLQIKTIESGQSNGVYNVGGTTTLPESSRITVSAVRYLYPIDESIGSSLKSEADINRSILARQIVEVKQGQWQAENLNIWEVAPNGNYQEAWQANPSQKNLTPDTEIAFIVTYDHQNQNLALQKQEKEVRIEPRYEKLEGKLVRFTNEGEKYAQAIKTEAISLPVGKTTPPRPQPEDINGGWGNRYQIKSQSVVGSTQVSPPSRSRQTNAPLSPSEFLR
jgi:hypothetical protein